MKQAPASPAGAGTFVEILVQVQKGARKGALSVVADELLVREAEEHAVDKFVEALLNQEEIGNPHAWGVRVGRNEACRLGELQQAWRTEPLEEQVGILDPEVEEGTDGEPPLIPDLQWLGQLFARRACVLTTWQRTVVQAVLEHDSLKGAAAELGKRLSDVTETFERALQRLAAGLDASEMPGE